MASVKLHPTNEAASAPAPPAGDRGREARTVLLVALGLFVAVLWAFLPSLRCGFIEYDDSVYVFNNPYVKHGLSARGLAWAFTDTSTGNWHPLTWLTHMLDAQLYGGAAWGHHLTSVLLHAITTMLLFLVWRRMTRMTWASLAAAALFGLHPMRVESVTWICERKDVLSGFFWVASLWAYARFAEASAKLTPGARAFYLASVVLFFCGLMSKPVMVTFPFVLLLLDFWPLGRWRKEKLGTLLREKLPFFLLTVLVCSVTYVAQKRTGMMSPLADLSFLERLENVPVAYVRYLGKTFWPFDLCALYPHPGRWPMGFVLGSLLLLLAVTALVFAQRTERPWWLVGWLWFLGALVPMIGLVQVGAQSMADRYSYIPIIGIWLAVSVGVAKLVKRWRPGPAWLCLGGLTLVCAVLTRQQITYWKDNATVWQRALAVTRNNYEAHYRLGRALAIEGNLAGAMAEFEQVVALRPGLAEAHYSLGKALALQGRLEEALARFQRAVEIDPRNVVALNNVGNILLQRGRYADSIAYFRRVLEIQADNAPAYGNLGYALAQTGRPDEAIAHLQKAIELQPQNSSAHNNLGSLFLRRGDFASAAAQFQIVLQLEPASAEAHNNLGSAWLGLGNVTGAVRSFRAAVALQPTAPELRRNLGFALMQANDLDAAIQELAEAVRLKPDYAEARSQLAAARAKQAAATSAPAGQKP